MNRHECFRAGSSGARTTIEYNGDITLADPIKYNIITECKYRLDITLDDLFPVLNSEVENWLEQSNEQIKLYNANLIKQENYNVPVSVIITGRPHMKVENYYTIIHQKPDTVDFKQKIISYSKISNSFIEIIPFSEFLDFLKHFYN